MKIAYLFSRFPVLSQTFCVTEIRGLEELGTELLIAAIHPPQTFLRHGQLRTLRAPVVYNPASSVLKSLEKSAKESGNWPADLVSRHYKEYGTGLKSAVRARNALWFDRECRTQGVEHIHVHFANRATHTALFLARMTGLPFSFTAHAQDFMLDFPDRRLLRELCAAAAFVVTVSDWSREVLAQEFPDLTSKFVRIHNGIDLTEFRPAHEQSDNGGTPRILSIGRLIPFKGFETLVDACGELVREGVAFECRIIGDGPLRESLAKRIMDHGLEGCVQLLGPQTQERVRAEMERASLFVLASRVAEDGACDVLPTVITEAMAIGRTVVSTNVAGIPEQVIDGVNGLIVPPNDPAALAAAMIKPLQDSDLRKRMGTAARARAEEMFDVRKSAAQLRLHFEQSVSSLPHPVAAPGRSKNRRSLLIADDMSLLDKLSLEKILPGGLDLLLPSTDSTWPGGVPANVRFFPPELILESLWLEVPHEADRFLSALEQLPAGFADRDFFTAARRFRHLERALQAEPRDYLIGCGPQSLLLCWLTNLTTGQSYSALIPEMPTAESSGHIKMICALSTSATRLFVSRQTRRLLDKDPKISIDKAKLIELP